MFQKKRYWQPNVVSAEVRSCSAASHPFLRNQVDNHRHHETLFTTLLSSTTPAFVADYTLHDAVVLSSASHISMVLSYVLQILKKDGGTLSDLRFVQPLIIQNQPAPLLQLIVNRQSGDFEVVSYKQQKITNFTTHVVGRVLETHWAPLPPIALDKVQSSLNKQYLGTKHRENAQKLGLSLGSSFQWIEQISYNHAEILATLRHAMVDELEGYDLAPGLIDACFQAMMAWTDFSHTNATLYLPQVIDKLVFTRFNSSPRYVYIKRDKGTVEHINLLDEEGTIVLQMTGLVTKELARPMLQEMQQQQYKNMIPTYTIDWIEVPHHVFDRFNASQELLEVLVISPKKCLLGALDSDLSSLSLRQTHEVPATINETHVVYSYPQYSASDEPHNFYHLHECIQKLLHMPFIERIGIIVEQGLYTSIVEGYWKTLCLEHHEKSIYLIEYGLHDEVLLSTVVRAQGLDGCQEHHVAIRQSRYYVPRLLRLEDFQQKNSVGSEEKKDPSATDNKQAHPPLDVSFKQHFYKKDKTYLITGGLGRLGKLLVTHLVTQGVNYLLLIGRQALATQPKWISDLKKQGVTIDYIAANVCDVVAMNTIVAEVNSSKATLAGVFHLAGRFKDKSIATLSQGDFELTFEAKINGAVALHQATSTLALDCFVLFSSIGASFGSPGQANYTAANSFMNALCKQRRAQGLPALSINWGPFRTTGMGTNHFSALQAAGLVPLNAVDAFVTMDQLLNTPYEQVIIADIKWQQITALVKNTQLLALLDEKDERHSSSSFATILKSTAKEKRAALLTAELKDSVSASFSLRNGQEIHEHKEFMEFGVDSLMTITLWNRLQAMVGPEQTLSKEMIMECTSIFKLSEYFKHHIFPEYFDTPIKKVPSFKLMNPVGSLVMTQSRASSSDYESGSASAQKKKKSRTDGAIDDVFLTGATGVLGGYLTKLFLEETKTTLHCLIRGTTRQEGLQRLTKVLKTYNVAHHLLSELENRVKIYCGDVSCDHFSLSPEEYCDLIDVSDLIIHSAAKISLGEAFEELYETNVLGTKNIINFALKTESKSLLYVSSYSVMGDIQINKHPAFKETDFDLGQGFIDMGYQKTKFESERAIRMAQSKGLNWRIVRPGNLFGDSVASVYPLGTNRTASVFYDLLKTVTETQVAFLSPLYFDITPVNYVAKAMLHIVFNLKQYSCTYHLTNPDIKTFSNIIQLLRDVGFPIEVIAMNDYIKRIYTNQLKHNGTVYQSLTTSLIQYRATKVIPVQSTPVDANWTRDILAKAGIQCPKIDKDLLSTLLSYCIKQGYISAQLPSIDSNVAKSSESN